MTEFFYLRVMEAHKGGRFTQSEDIRFSSERGAMDAAEKLQEDFDEDCDPKRAYVLDSDKVPVRAAGRSKMSPMKSIKRS